MIPPRAAPRPARSHGPWSSLFFYIFFLAAPGTPGVGSRPFVPHVDPPFSSCISPRADCARLLCSCLYPARRKVCLQFRVPTSHAMVDAHSAHAGAVSVDWAHFHTWEVLQVLAAVEEVSCRAISLSSIPLLQTFLAATPWHLQLPIGGRAFRASSGLPLCPFLQTPAQASPSVLEARNTRDPVRLVSLPVLPHPAAQ